MYDLCYIIPNPPAPALSRFMQMVSIASQDKAVLLGAVGCHRASVRRVVHTLDTVLLLRRTKVWCRARIIVHIVIYVHLSSLMD